MTSQPDDYDYREEGESLFEWPLDAACMRMGAGELLWTACSRSSSI